MYKQIALILIASLLCFSPQKAFGLPESKQVMIVAIKEWVTAETKLQSSQIKENALDRRLQVPECGSEFSISFPYSKSQKQLRSSVITRNGRHTLEFSLIMISLR